MGNENKCLFYSKYFGDSPYVSFITLKSLKMFEIIKYLNC